MSDEDRLNLKNWVWVPDEEHVFVRGCITENDLKSDEVKVTVQKGNQDSPLTVKKCDLEPCNPPKFNKCDDMADLTHLNEPSVIYNLQLRYSDDLIYTYSGLFLVAINPYKALPIYDSTILHRFHNHEYDKPPPHIFATAEGTYRNLLANKKNQSILVTGESGAGKTENTKKIIQYLSLITPKDHDLPKSSTIDTKILQANPILESFGNAKTIKNNNSSRFGKFIKIFFSSQGKIDGATIEYYLLEKSRVVYQSLDERNYHVFYQFLKGQTDLKLSLWSLTKNLKEYAYLKNSKFDIQNVDDSRDFNCLVDAFDIMGFSESETNNIFTVLAVILHLGNLDFTSMKAEQASFSKGSPVKIIANLLGVSESDLSSNLLRPKVKAGKEYVAKSRKAPEVKYVIDAFAKHLYEKVFQYIIERINDNLQGDTYDDNYSIGVLDIAGFEIFDTNSFEQLCINYTNEKLQQFFNHHSFILEQSEYLKENIQWEFIDFGQDLQPTIDLIETRKPMGVLEILNEQCMFPKSSDKSFMEKLAEEWDGKSAKFKQNKFKSGFIINHYAGVVEYNVENWLVKNTDPVSENILNLMPQSSNQFISDLFGTEITKSKHRTASQKHKEQLSNLMDQLGSTEPHFVRCILPNLNKKPNRFDKSLVLHQLRCNGVLEGIRITRAGYPNKLHFEDFFSRYQILNKDLMFTKNMKTNCELILKKLGLEEATYKIGITKIFFKNGILGQLEEMREQVLRSTFTEFQSIIRGNSSRQIFKDQIRRIQASQLIAKNFMELDNSLAENQWFKLFINIKPLLEESVKVLDSKEVNENLKKINGKLKDAENAKTHLEAENTTLKESMSKLEDEIIATNNLMKEKASQLSKLVNEEKTSSRKVGELERQLSEIKALNERLAKDKVEYDDKLKKLTEAVTTHVKDFDDLKEQYKLSTNRIKQLEAQIKTFDSNKKNHDLTINNMKKEFEATKSISSGELVKLRDLNKSLNTQTVQLEKQLKDVTSRVKDLETQLAEKVKLISQLKKENDSFKNETLVLNEKLLKLQELEKSFQLELVNQQQILKELNQAKTSLQQQIDENRLLEGNYKSLKAEIEKLQKTKHDSAVQIAEYKHRIAHMTKEFQQEKENINPHAEASLMEDFGNIKLKLNEQSAHLRNERFENKKLSEEISILKDRLKKNNLNSSIHSPTKENRRSVAIGEEIMMKSSSNEIESLKMRLEQEEANAIRAENYAIELQKKLNKLQSTRGLNSYTDYEKKFKDAQSRINELESRYEKMLNDSSDLDKSPNLDSSTRPLSRSDSLGFGMSSASGNSDFAKIYQDITRTLRTTREELNTSKMEILRLKSLLRESEEELYDVKRNNFKVSVSDYEEELAQLKVKHDTVSAKNQDLLKSMEMYKKRSDEYYKKLELAESAVSISKRHETQAKDELTKTRNELNLTREELKTSGIFIKDLRQEIYKKEEIINDKEFKLQQLRAQITNLEDKLSYINKNYGDNKELENKYKEDIAQLNKDINFKLETETRLIKENKQLQLDLEELTSAEQALRLEFEEIFEKNENLLVENSELSSKLRLVEGEYAISERKNGNLNKQIRSLKDLNEEIMKQKEELLEIKDQLNDSLEMKRNECENLIIDLNNSESTCKILREHLDNQRSESKEMQNELNQLKSFNRSETHDYAKVLKDKLVITEENDSLKKANTELKDKVNKLEDKLYNNEQLRYWESKVNALMGELDDSQGEQHESLKKISALEREVRTLNIRLENESKLTKKYNDENFNYQNQVGHFKSSMDILTSENEEKDLVIRAHTRDIDELRETLLLMEKENLQLKQQLGV